MTRPFPALSLRRLLLIDAAVGAATGALLSAAAVPLGALLALPVPLLFAAGLALLPIAAFMAWVGTRAQPPVAGVWIIVVGNAAWATASVALPLAGLVAPNALGLAFLLGQAGVVALLAWLEREALTRRHGPLAQG